MRRFYTVYVVLFRHRIWATSVFWRLSY